MASEILQEVVGNLLDNARVHGGPAVEVEVTLTRDGPAILIGVRDDGPGVSPANAERIFRGTGLGLSIVRALVEAHGGTLVLEPSDVEACFLVSLPQAP